MDILSFAHQQVGMFKDKLSSTKKLFQVHAIRGFLLFSAHIYKRKQNHPLKAVRLF